MNIRAVRIVLRVIILIWMFMYATGDPFMNITYKVENKYAHIITVNCSTEKTAKEINVTESKANNSTLFNYKPGKTECQTPGYTITCGDQWIQIKATWEGEGPNDKFECCVKYKDDLPKNCTSVNVDHNKMYVQFIGFKIYPEEKLCSLEHDKDSWRTFGTIRMVKSSFLKTHFKPELIMEVSNTIKPKIWKFDLNNCNPLTESEIGHFCRSTKTSTYVAFRIKEIPDSSISDGKLTAFIYPQKNDSNHKIIKHDIGTLPRIYATIQVTYELVGFVKQSRLLREQSVTVTSAVPRELVVVFCARNIQAPYNLSVNNHTISSVDDCGTGMVPMKTGTVKLSYRETACLQRQNSFDLNIDFNNSMWVYVLVSLGALLVSGGLIYFTIVVCGREKVKTKRQWRHSFSNSTTRNTSQISRFKESTSGSKISAKDLSTMSSPPTKDISSMSSPATSPTHTSWSKKSKKTVSFASSLSTESSSNETKS